MKLKIGLLIVGCFLSINLFAQTPKAIETDLKTSYDKIDYWNNQKDTVADATDSIASAEGNFEIKLEYYTSKYPSTLTRKFGPWLPMVTSKDNLLRIYFGNTELGGTEEDYWNIIQYKTEQVVKIDTNFSEKFKIPEYDTIYTLKRNNKTYYLAIYSAKMDIHIHREGVQIFAIEGDTLNDNVKLIKTGSGLHSRLDYEYNDNYIYSEQQDSWPDIIYDEKSTVIKIPVIMTNGRGNGKFITYKFTGQYFEKVK